MKPMPVEEVVDGLMNDPRRKNKNAEDLALRLRKQKQDEIYDLKTQMEIEREFDNERN